MYVGVIGSIVKVLYKNVIFFFEEIIIDVREIVSNETCTNDTFK